MWHKHHNKQLLQDWLQLRTSIFGQAKIIVRTAASINSKLVVQDNSFPSPVEYTMPRSACSHFHCYCNYGENQVCCQLGALDKHVNALSKFLTSATGYSIRNCNENYCTIWCAFEICRWVWPVTQWIKGLLSSTWDESGIEVREDRRVGHVEGMDTRRTHHNCRTAWELSATYPGAEQYGV